MWISLNKLPSDQWNMTTISQCTGTGRSWITCYKWCRWCCFVISASAPEAFKHLQQNSSAQLKSFTGISSTRATNARGTSTGGGNKWLYQQRHLDQCRSRNLRHSCLASQGHQSRQQPVHPVHQLPVHPVHQLPVHTLHQLPVHTMQQHHQCQCHLPHHKTQWCTSHCMNVLFLMHAFLDDLAKNKHCYLSLVCGISIAIVPLI